MDWEIILNRTRIHAVRIGGCNDPRSLRKVTRKISRGRKLHSFSATVRDRSLAPRHHKGEPFLTEQRDKRGYVASLPLPERQPECVSSKGGCVDPGGGKTVTLTHTVCEGVAYWVSHPDRHSTQRLGGGVVTTQDLMRVSGWCCRYNWACSVV